MRRGGVCGGYSGEGEHPFPFSFRGRRQSVRIDLDR